LFVWRLLGYQFGTWRSGGVQMQRPLVSAPGQVRASCQAPPKTIRRSSEDQDRSSTHRSFPSEAQPSCLRRWKKRCLQKWFQLTSRTWSKFAHFDGNHDDGQWAVGSGQWADQQQQQQTGRTNENALRWKKHLPLHEYSKLHWSSTLTCLPP